jgi:hypothetical protein
MSYLGILSTAVPIAPATWTTTTTQSGFTSAIPDSATDKKNQEVPQPSVFFRPKSLTIGYSKKKEKEENTDNFTKILKLANKKQIKTSTIHKQTRNDCNSRKQSFLASFLP